MPFARIIVISLEQKCCKLNNGTCCNNQNKEVQYDCCYFCIYLNCNTKNTDVQEKLKYELMDTGSFVKTKDPCY